MRGGWEWPVEMQEPIAIIATGEPSPCNDPINSKAGENGTATPAAPAPCARREVRGEKLGNIVRIARTGRLACM